MSKYMDATRILSSVEMLRGKQIINHKYPSTQWYKWCGFGGRWQSREASWDHKFNTSAVVNAQSTNTINHHSETEHEKRFSSIYATIQCLITDRQSDIFQYSFIKEIMVGFVCTRPFTGTLLAFLLFMLLIVLHTRSSRQRTSELSQLLPLAEGQLPKEGVSGWGFIQWCSQFTGSYT